MKRFFILLAFILFVIGLANSQHDFRASGRFGVFYTSLSQHGEWFQSDFGDAWRPLHVQHGWRPYVYGRWAWTDYGWYWVSSEPFGWATYHYGRWYYDNYYGWIWIPDSEWGPGWVEWCHNDDYIGWAPLSPNASFSFSVGITFSSGWITPIHYWNFIRYRHFTDSHVFDYVQPSEYNRRISDRIQGGNTIRYENNRIMNRGIDRDVVERRGNIRINRVDIIEKDRGESERYIRKDGRQQVEVYRPRFDDKRKIDREISIDLDRTMRENRLSRPDVRSDDRQNSETKQNERNNARNRENIRERIQSDRRMETTPPERQNVQRETQKKEIQQRQQLFERQREQRELWQQQQEQQRMSEQQMREKKVREIPRTERPQSEMRQQPERQMRERTQQEMRERTQRPERSGESRGGREKRRP